MTRLVISASGEGLSLAAPRSHGTFGSALVPRLLRNGTFGTAAVMEGESKRRVVQGVAADLDGHVWSLVLARLGYFALPTLQLVCRAWKELTTTNETYWCHLAIDCESRFPFLPRYYAEGYAAKRKASFRTTVTRRYAPLLHELHKAWRCDGCVSQRVTIEELARAARPMCEATTRASKGKEGGFNTIGFRKCRIADEDRVEGFSAGVVVASIFAGVLGNESSVDAKFSESIAVMKLFGFGIKATCLHEAGDSLESGDVAFVVDDVREEKERRVQSPFANEQGKSQYSLRFRPHVLESVRESLVICEQRLIARLGFTQEECNAFFNAYERDSAVPSFAIRVGGVPVDTQGEAYIGSEEELLLQVCQDAGLWVSLAVTESCDPVSEEAPFRLQAFAQR
jgi:hypothetical protein